LEKKQPGTGKTTTLVELIYQAITQYQYTNILVAAPSNVAVDNILSRLVQMQQRTTSTSKKSNVSKSKNSTISKKIKMVRIGHPARIQSSIQQYSLDALVQNADGTEIVQDIRKELQSHITSLSSKQSSKQHGTNNRRQIYSEMNVLRKEIRKREEKVVQELISNAQVVLTTCVGAATLLQ
jgi:superfamily I DNA and/or RNA helicase